MYFPVAKNTYIPLINRFSEWQDTDTEKKAYYKQKK